VQCLDDFNIPLLLNHTVTIVHGKERLEGITIAEVDKHLKAIQGTEQYIKCDTLLLSVGLVPENELSKKIGIEFDPVTKGAMVNEKRRTNVPWVFACGNVLHVHDLVDNVTAEGEIAGKAVADYINNKLKARKKRITVSHDNNIGYVVPQAIEFNDVDEKNVKLYMRVRQPDNNVRLVVKDDKGKVIADFKKEIVAPGSMIMLTIPTKLILCNINAINVSIMK
jgi:pyruvate/2-oxoglutarate dehydrogenase complex dihydrolipoamide dehydrogenase (E3) component